MDSEKEVCIRTDKNRFLLGLFNPFPNDLIFKWVLDLDRKAHFLCTSKAQFLKTLTEETSENIVGKEENTGDRHFFLSLPPPFTMFSSFSSTNFNCCVTFIKRGFANVFNLVMRVSFYLSGKIYLKDCNGHFLFLPTRFSYFIVPKTNPVNTH